MSSKIEAKWSTKIWLKGDFLLRCLVPLSPPSRLVTHNLKRMIAYAKAKVSFGCGDISFDVWQHVACQKLGMKYDLATMYFRLMSDILASSDCKMRKYHDQIFSGKIGTSVKLSIPLVPFALMLFLQQCNRRDVRNSMKAPDKYPAERLSESLQFSFGSKENFEQQVLDFVREHLRSLIELIVLSEETVKDHRSPEINKKFFSIASLSHLDYIFEGQCYQSESDKKSVMTFSQLIKFALKKNDEDEIEINFIENFIRSKLQNDVFVVASPTEISGLSSELQLDNEDVSLGPSLVKAKIVHNTKMSPDTHRVVMFSGIIRSTVVKGNDVLNQAIGHVFKCQNSHLYLMSPLKCLSIRKCRGTLVFSCPVSEVLRVQYCRDMIVIAVCRRLIISNCQRCTFHVKTPSNPLVLGNNNEDLIFGPFHTSYPQLESHLTECGLSTEIDFWEKPLCLINGDNVNQEECKASWSLLEPKKFFPFYLPFKISGPVSKIPGGLPFIYKSEVDRRQKCLKEWNESVSDVEEETKNQLKIIMQERFSLWLEKEEKKNELDQLKKLQGYQQKKTKKPL